MRLFAVVCAALVLSAVVLAESKDGKRGLAKTTTAKSESYFLINNWFNFYYNNGDGSINNGTGQSGGEFPKGSGKTAIFEDGLVIGGYYRGTGTGNPARSGRMFVNGSTYGSGLQEGRIITPGTGVAGINNAVGDDASLPIYRMFRVRTDVSPSTPAADAKLLISNQETALIGRFKAVTTDQLYQQYLDDWNEWPASQGAPWYGPSKLTTGVYAPAVDTPGIKGADMTMWHVANDANVSIAEGLYGSDPVGLEMQRTIWGYNRQGALGNIIFLQYKLINKSGTWFDSTFVAMWSDPDLGFAGDDFTGCDTTRSLGFVYNGKGTDLTYGEATPSSGYVFFQGPRIAAAPTDSAVWNLKYIKGYKSLKMSSFNMFINSNANYADPRLQNVLGTPDWYNLMNGKVGRTGATYINPITGLPSKFLMSGDPSKGTGWLDGKIAPPGDRRLALIAGPYATAPGDTQEVVVAMLAGQGADRLSSVDAIKATSDEAQASYNLLFDLPNPPPQPTVTVTPLDGAIMLTWGQLDKVKALEVDYTSKGYTFEGYRVYQSPTPAFKDYKVVATYDVVDPVLDNGGIQRFIKLTTDQIRSKPLVNGTTYYFGVSSVGYNPVGVPVLIESSPILVQMIPQTPALGMGFNSQALEAITVTKGVGTGGATVGVTVVDPAATVTGNYVISFPSTGNFNVVNTTTSDTILKNQVDFSGSPTSVIAKGLQVKIGGSSFSAPERYGSITTTTPSGLLVTWGGGHLIGGGTTDLYVEKPFGLAYARAVPASKTQWDFELRFTGVPATTTVVGGATVADHESFVSSGGSIATMWVRGAYANNNLAAVAHENCRVPWELWDVENNLQINSAFISRNSDGLAPWGTNGPIAAGTSRFRISARDYIVPVYTPYPGDATALTTTFSPNDVNATWMIFFEDAADGLSDSYWMTGDKVAVKIPNPLIVGSDTWTFSLVGTTLNSKALQQKDADIISVFPNPYFAFNSAEPDKYTRFVTFNRLPQEATIRIFTLSGILVKTLQKNNTSQFFRWNLLNESGLPVGSGMYIVNIDMPKIGKTKILKLAVVQPQQILDRY
jgi:hypothetical protein